VAAFGYDSKTFSDTFGKDKGIYGARVYVVAGEIEARQYQATGVYL
jgi:hypothetical protein